MFRNALQLLREACIHRFVVEVRELVAETPYPPWITLHKAHKLIYTYDKLSAAIDHARQIATYPCVRVRETTEGKVVWNNLDRVREI